MEKPKDPLNKEQQWEEKPGAIEIHSPEELRTLVLNIPDGVVYSIQLEVRLSNE